MLNTTITSSFFFFKHLLTIFCDCFRCARICNGIADFSAIQARCGRPLGLSFDSRTGNLYIADAYFGLMRVCSKGGTATQLVSNVQGRPLRFTYALDIDPNTGVVYFTEASSNFRIR